MSTRLLAIWAVLALGFAAVPATAAEREGRDITPTPRSEHRLGLVIGNSAYKTAPLHDRLG